VKVDGLRRIWLRSVSAYTLGGIAAGGLVGACAGWLGAGLLTIVDQRWVFVATTLIGGAVVLRESIGRGWPIPQLRRQTPEHLRLRYGAPTAAGIWGFDLGLVFSTWLTFAGPWFLLAAAIAFGEPLIGMALFIGHWLARAAWLWLSAYLLPSARIGPAFSRQVSRNLPVFRVVQVLAVGIGIGAMILLAVNGT
jgi:hypothetical protein